MGLDIPLDGAEPLKNSVQRLEFHITNGGAENVAETLDFENSDLFVSVSDGKVQVQGSADVNGVTSEVRLTFDRDANKGLVALRGKTEVEKLFSAVTRAGLSNFGNIDISKVRATGDVEFDLGLNIPLDGGFDIAESIEKLDLSINHGSSENLISNVLIEKVQLRMSVYGTTNSVLGSAVVGGLETKVKKIEIDHEKEFLIIEFDAEASESNNKLLENLLGLEMVGEVGIQVRWPLVKEAELDRMELTFDLEKAAISSPGVPWLNGVLSGGAAKVFPGFSGGRFNKRIGLDVNVGGLKLLGDIEVSSGGDIETASFDSIAWNNNIVNDVFVTSNSRKLSDDIETSFSGEFEIRGGWDVLATDIRKLDLESFREVRGNSKTGKIRFDLSGEGIIIHKELSLNGSLKGEALPSGNVKAKFTGNTMLRGEKIQFQDIEISSNSAASVLQANGLIEDGSGNIVFNREDREKPFLIVESDSSGGELLDAFGIASIARGGKLKLRTDFHDQDMQDYDSKIELANFRLLKAPSLLKLYSLFTLESFDKAAESENDEVSFKYAEALLKKRGEIIKIPHIKAVSTGKSMVLHLVGNYDKSANFISLSGNLVPADVMSVFREILTLPVFETVPVLGDLLLKVDGVVDRLLGKSDSLIVNQFKIVGNPDDEKLTIKINRLKSFAPGFVRDILKEFSEDWVDKEETRLMAQ